MNRRQKTTIAKDKRPAHRCGAAATEFVIVLPVMVAIALGCVDLGRGICTSITLSNAVREGAQYGATTGFTDYTKSTWQNEIRDRIVEELSIDRDFQAADLDVTVTTEQPDDETVTLSVTATYPFETIVDWPGLPHQVKLRHQVSMQRYR